MDILEIITREVWIQTVKSHLNTSEFELLNCKVNPLTIGGGFLGEHHLAEVNVRVKNPKEPEKVLHYFIKTEPQKNKIQKDMLAQTGCFSKEVSALSDVLVQLRSALEDEGKGMEWTCKCFHTRPGVIVLEDLIHQGYRVVGVGETLGYQRCSLVVKALANLHAASLIFEETRPNQPYRLDQEYGETLAERFFCHAHNHPGTQFMRIASKGMLTLVEQVRGEDTRRRFQDRLCSALELFYETRKPSETFRNVVNHSDLWENNMMFLHEEGEAIAVRLVDFQMVGYAPPTNDIYCFLHLSTSRSFREKYTSKLLTLYYDELSKNLKRYDLDPEQVLPWKQFKESCEFYKKVGVAIAAYYLSVTMLSGDVLKPVFASPTEFERFMLKDRTPEMKVAYKTDTFYRKRATDIIEELIETFIEKE